MARTLEGLHYHNLSKVSDKQKYRIYGHFIGDIEFFFKKIKEVCIGALLHRRSHSFFLQAIQPSIERCKEMVGSEHIGDK